MLFQVTKMPIHFIKAFFLLSFMCFTFFACQNTDAIEESFVNVYLELRMNSLEHGNNSIKAKEYRSAILKKHGYTVESFREYTEFIQNNPHLWLPFQNKVLHILDSILEPQS